VLFAILPIAMIVLIVALIVEKKKGSEAPAANPKMSK
jgi:hypothetical protein